LRTQLPTDIATTVRTAARNAADKLEAALTAINTDDAARDGWGDRVKTIKAKESVSAVSVGTLKLGVAETVPPEYLSALISLPFFWNDRGAMDYAQMLGNHW
jgi:hypothetical protein